MEISEAKPVESPELLELAPETMEVVIKEAEAEAVHEEVLEEQGASAQTEEAPKEELPSCDAPAEAEPA